MNYNNKITTENESFFENLLEDLPNLNSNRPEASYFSIFKHYIPSSSMQEESCVTAYQAIRVATQYLEDANWQACIRLAQQWLDHCEFKYQHEFHNLMAISYNRCGQTQNALIHYEKTLESFPLDWMAIEAICSLGHEPPKLHLNSFALSTEFKSKRDLSWLKLIVSIYNSLADINYLLRQHESRQALKIMESLDINLKSSSRIVLLFKAKSFYDVSEFKKSADAFKELLVLDPKRVNDMDIYSSVLWHTKNMLELHLLSKRLLSQSRTSPEAWIALGNVYSLKKEHDIAIKSFQRATQVDSNCSYAFVLSGHEYAMNEDFDDAITCFRKALRLDEKSYHAWFGLGDIFYRQEKYQLAHVHWTKALSLHKSSFLLLCHMGMLQQKLENDQEALYYYNQSLQLAPKNPLVLYRTASLLYQMNRFQQALTVLGAIDEQLMESNVYLLKAKILKALKKDNLALVQLSLAQGFDGKQSGQHLLEHFYNETELLQDIIAL